jgi:hypothetical protein
MRSLLVKCVRKLVHLSSLTSLDLEAKEIELKFREFPVESIFPREREKKKRLWEE